ncbi:abortive infection family protein [Streptomyces caelestis]|uniref:abortive infection family protein n=1 Tax=Streptomyces caelestis TaxID=36816 RepID=UPI0036A3A587
MVSTVQKALKLNAGSAPDGPDNSKAVKKILSGSVDIAVRVAELLNQGFGSGHVQASAPSGLGVRHARLRVNAAVTWCELILDTLSGPAAPWRKQQSVAAPAPQTWQEPSRELWGGPRHAPAVRIQSRPRRF